MTQRVPGGDRVGWGSHLDRGLHGRQPTEETMTLDANKLGIAAMERNRTRGAGRLAVALILGLCASLASGQALAAEPGAQDSAGKTTEAGSARTVGHHGAGWFGPGYRSPGLAAVLSLTPMPVDFGNLYAENFGWGLGYTAVEVGLAAPLMWLGAGHMCHDRFNGGDCARWTDGERGLAIGLLSGYVGVKLVAAIHAAHAADAYNRADASQRSSFGVAPFKDGAGLGWTLLY